MANPTLRHLVLDLGDVVMNWKPPRDGNISPKMLKRAMTTLPWYKFECGQISEEECYKQIGDLLSLPPSDIAHSINGAKLSLECDQRFVSALKELKLESHGGLKIHAMSNVSVSHFNFVRSKPWDWDLFDEIFISGKLGVRKPDLKFYEDVLHAIGQQQTPHNVTFVDDKRENVLSALSLGMQAFRFEDSSTMVQRLYNIFGNQIEKSQQFLQRHAKTMQSTTSNGHVIKENFSQLLILEASGDRSLVSLVEGSLMWNFFQEESALYVGGVFPNDFDTTSLAMMILKSPTSVAHAVMDRAIKNMSPDGIVRVYDDPNRPRIDVVVCIHVFTLFYHHNREHELGKTYNWIYNVLFHRAYLDGTLYYSTPECLLFALSRLVSEAQQSNKTLPPNLILLFRLRCKERIGLPGDSLALAMRIIACLAAGIELNELQNDLQDLRMLQCEDGGWPFCGIYRGSLADFEIGNRGVTTAFAINAIKAAEVELELGHKKIHNAVPALM